MASYRLSITFITLLAVFPAQAQQFQLQQLINLANSGQAEAGYNYAWQHLTGQEGDPIFDYYFGLVAIDSGNVSQGVFALERTIAVEPGNQAARLELARGYFLLEEFKRSKDEFLTVMASQPPSIVRDRIERFLDAIRREEGRYQTTYTGFAEFGLGYDDNVNSGPSEDVIEFDSGAILTLDPQSLQLGDVYSNLKTGGKINIPYAPGRIGFVSGDVEARVQAEESDYNNSSIGLQGGLIWLAGASRYQVELDLQHFTFNGEAYRTSTGINADWRTRTQDKHQWSAFTQYTMSSYPDNELRDSAMLTVGTGYSYTFLAKYSPMLFTNIYIGSESPEASGDDADRIAKRDIFGLRIGTQLSLNSRHLLAASLGLQSSEHGAKDIFENKTRKDSYLNLNLDWTWRWAKTYSLSTQLNVIDNGSNLGIYDFQRSSIETALRMEFD